MGWFSKKKKHRAGVKTKLGIFMFDEDFGSWSWWPIMGDNVALIFRHIDFDLAAFAALSQLLPELDTYVSKALAYIKQSAWADKQVSPQPESLEFTKILDHCQIEIDFTEAGEFGLHFTVQFRDGEPVKIYAGD